MNEKHYEAYHNGKCLFGGVIDRLGELEDMIESGEICRFSELHSIVCDEVKKNFQSNIKHVIDEYFAKCEDEIKKQTAKDVIDEFEKHGIVSEYFVKYLRKEYGV